MNFPLAFFFTRKKLVVYFFSAKKGDFESTFLHFGGILFYSPLLE